MAKTTPDPAAELNRLLIGLGLKDAPDATPSGRVPMEAEAILRRQIGRYQRRLERRQEITLARLARAGDETARARLALHNLRLVIKLAWEKWSFLRALDPDLPGALRADLIQE